MKAAVVTGAGERPVHMEFDAPHAMPGHRLIDVTASALSRIAQARASGQHYSSDGHYPFVVGVDGVGRLDDTAQRAFVTGVHHKCRRRWDCLGHRDQAVIFARTGLSRVNRLHAHCSPPSTSKRKARPSCAN